MLIGLAGKFGAGKDAVADVMVERYGFRKLSFAEPLRIECAEALSMCKFPDSMPTDLHWELTRLYITCPDRNIIWAKPTRPEVRRMLQWWGSDFRRAQDPDYWTKRAAEIIAAEPRHIVISDARYLNEAQLVKQFGKLWLVQRPSLQLTEHHSHISEQFVDTYTDWDLVINNNSDLPTLQSHVSSLARCELEIDRAINETATSLSHAFGLTLGECDWIAERGRIIKEQETPTPL